MVALGLPTDPCGGLFTSRRTYLNWSGEWFYYGNGWHAKIIKGLNLYCGMSDLPYYECLLPSSDIKEALQPNSKRVSHSVVLFE